MLSSSPGKTSPSGASSLKRKAVDISTPGSKKVKHDGSITSFFGTPKTTGKEVDSITFTSPSINKDVESFSIEDPSSIIKDATTIKVNKNPEVPVASIFKLPDNSGHIPPTSPLSAKTSVKFDKSAWISKLTSEQKELLDLEINTLDESWLAVLKEDIVHPSFLSLKKFLQEERSKGKEIFPPEADVYSWSRHTPLHKIKAVILGQDPYHNTNQAHGLCFSVRPPTKSPPSLKNIYIALKRDYPSFRPPPNNLGLLTPWADRGVLLLNTCLTVRAHEANSHANKGWERFTGRVLEEVVNRRKDGVVFLAWGTPAQNRCKIVKGRHLVLKSVHPSPLSASRGFFDCGHFKKANEWLRERYGADGEIDWNLGIGGKTIEKNESHVESNGDIKKDDTFDESNGDVV